MRMNRTNRGPVLSDDGAAQPADSADSDSRAKTAENIAAVAFGLAQQARSAGFAQVCHLLEMAALEAGAEATAGRWPFDVPKG
jgi:hypothetical protein